MATMEQIRQGVMAYADAEIVPALDGIKQVIVGAGLEFYIRKKLPALVGSLGIAEENGDIDVDLLADVLKRRVNKLPDGIEIKLPLNPMNRGDVDVFRFKGQDIENLVKYIKEV